MKLIRFFAREYALSGLFIILLLGLWEIVVRALDLAAFILPPPSQILSKFAASHRLLLSHGLVTLTEALGGFFSVGYWVVL